MAYESASISRFKCRYDSDNDDNTILFQLVRAGVKVTPTSATIAIYKPGNSTAVLAATSMGSASGTLFTYAIDTTTVADFPVGNGFRARIVVTVGSTTYDEDVYFDVVKTVPQGRITRDQLVKLDERVSTMQYAGDDDFSELIEGVWEDVQLDIESREVDGVQMTEDMIVDRSRLSVAMRCLCLSRILRPKGEREDAEYWEDTYRKKLRQILSGAIRHDTDQDQEEDSEGSLAVITRIVN